MKNIKKLGLIAFVALFGLSSCLKDKDFNDQKVGLDLTKSPKIIEIVQAPEADVVFNVSTSPLTQTMITIATGANVTEDVSVTLVKDDNLVTAAGYGVLASTAYTIGSLTVTIPKGKNSVDVPITVKNTASLLGTNFALGFKLGAISNPSFNQSSRYNTVVCPIIVQNQYAGMYNVTGSRYNYTGAIAYNFPGPIPAGAAVLAHPAVKEMFTIDANTSEIGVAGLAGLNYYYQITVPPGSTGSSEINCPLAFNSQFNLDNSGIEIKKCTYVPDTKTFSVVIRYLNSGGNTRIMVEQFVKQP
jgi:Domain of unknown function (DUF1735)